jgi:hypothetical protein
MQAEFHLDLGQGDVFVGSVAGFLELGFEFSATSVGVR